MAVTATTRPGSVRLLTPRLQVALRIIAGRGMARACMQLSMLALLPVWGAERFGPYVAATGAFNWLTMLVLGAEKTALTVLPRHPVLAPQLARMVVARSAAPAVAGALLAVALLPLGGGWALYAAAATYAGSQGLMSVLASLHRLDDHPGRETAAYVAFALWVVALAGLAVLGVVQPLTYLVALLVGQLVVCAVLALGVPALRARPPRVRSGRLLRHLVDRRVLLLGVSEVAGGVAIAVLYVVLSIVGTPTDAATVYVVLVISSVVGSLSILVLRLLQPGTAMRLRGTGAAAGRALAMRLSAWSASVTVALLVAGAAVLLLRATSGGTDAVASIAASKLVLGLVVVVEMTLFCVVVYTIFLLENTTGTALRLTSASAVVGVLATTASGLLLVPVLHAVGALAAMVVGLAARSTLIAFRLRSGAPATSAEHGDRALLGGEGTQ